jgi:hypothetical protein
VLQDLLAGGNASGEGNAPTALLPLILTLTLQACDSATPRDGPTLHQVVSLIDDAVDELQSGTFMDCAGQQQVRFSSDKYTYLCV